jgi:hypothetical protein
MKVSILKRTTLVLGALLLGGLFLASGPALAKKDTPFSAEHITISPDGAKEMKSMVYFTKDKMRMEMNQPGGPGKMIVIYLKSEKKMIMINPAKKAYFEMPLDEDQWPDAEGKSDAQKKKLGKEKVSGYKCTKYSVVRKMKFMGKEKEIKVTSWESDKFAMPLRTKTEDGGVQELRNIKEGKPPAKVFKVPGGYKKAGNMMEMMRP